MFDPVAMRIHPVFTQVKDFTGDGKPDGIEALVQLTDRFGDSTKAAGTMMLELFDYRRTFPDPRSGRLGQPWIIPLKTIAEQQSHWRRVGAAYAMQLPFPKISNSSHYVLSATFTPVEGDRMFDQIVIVPQQQQSQRPGQEQQKDVPNQPTTAPAAPSARPSP